MSYQYTQLVKLPINEPKQDTKPSVSDDDEYAKPRKCERTNYTPSSSDVVYSRKEWHNVYNRELIDMYNILVRTLNQKYPDNTINWAKYNSDIFHNFSRLLYHCSSKHIDSYDIDNYKESISKDLNNILKDGESKETTICSIEGVSERGQRDVSEEWTTTRSNRNSRR